MTERKHEGASAGGPRERGCQQEHATGDSGSAHRKNATQVWPQGFRPVLCALSVHDREFFRPGSIGPNSRSAILSRPGDRADCGNGRCAAQLALGTILGGRGAPCTGPHPCSAGVAVETAHCKQQGAPAVFGSPTRIVGPKHCAPTPSAALRVCPIRPRSARDHPLCLPRSLHPAHIDSNAHTRVRVHTTTTATRTHTHTASLSLSRSLPVSSPYTQHPLSRARALQAVVSELPAYACARAGACRA